MTPTESGLSQAVADHCLAAGHPAVAVAPRSKDGAIIWGIRIGPEHQAWSAPSPVSEEAIAGAKSAALKACENRKRFG